MKLIMKINFNYQLVLMTFILTGCVYSYSPDISKYEEVFVIDGELTNLPGPYVVTLSKSYSFNEHKGDFVCGAMVKIIDINGKEEELKEIEDGTYSTEGSNFQGEVGNSYKLQITLNNDVYESDFEMIKNPVEIDQVYWEYMNNDDNEYGIQLLLDTHDPLNNTLYYAWDYEETWKFRVPLDIFDHPEWKECFDFFQSSTFNIATSAQRNHDIIEGYPLKFIDEETNRLYIRYSILVKQYALTESSYKFFKDLITINQEQGTLFDPIPSSLVGNVNCLSNTDMPVLGYFLVSGVSKKRIFIDRDDLPWEYSPTTGFDNCATVSVFAPIEYRDNVKAYAPVDSVLNLGYSIYEENVYVDYAIIEVVLAKAACYNCLLNGESEVPDFWIEKEGE